MTILHTTDITLHNHIKRQLHAIGITEPVALHVQPFEHTRHCCVIFFNYLDAHRGMAVIKRLPGVQNIQASDHTVRFMVEAQS